MLSEIHLNPGTTCLLMTRQQVLVKKMASQPTRRVDQSSQHSEEVLGLEVST